MKKVFAVLLLLAAGAVAEDNCIVVTGVKGDFNAAYVMKSCGNVEKAKRAVQEFAKEKGKNPENVFFVNVVESWYQFTILD